MASVRGKATLEMAVFRVYRHKDVDPHLHHYLPCHIRRYKGSRLRGTSASSVPLMSCQLMRVLNLTLCRLCFVLSWYGLSTLLTSTFILIEISQVTAWLGVTSGSFLLMLRG